MSSEIWGFIGVIIGSLVTIMMTIINNKNTIKVQSNLELNKRKELFREFQRKNIFQVQEKINATARLIGKIHIHDIEEFKKSNKWNNTDLSDELNNELADSFRELSMINERIYDADLRIEIEKLIDEMAKCLFSNNLAKSKQQVRDIVIKVSEVSKKTGVVLRNFY